jgi:hypothetical protein
VQIPGHCVEKCCTLSQREDEAYRDPDIMPAVQLWRLQITDRHQAEKDENNTEP